MPDPIDDSRWEWSIRSIANSLSSRSDPIDDSRWEWLEAYRQGIGRYESEEHFTGALVGFQAGVAAAATSAPSMPEPKVIREANERAWQEFLAAGAHGHDMRAAHDYGWDAAIAFAAAAGATRRGEGDE